MHDRPICCGKKMRKYDVTKGGRQRWRCGACGASTTNNAEYVTGYDAEAAERYHAELRDRLASGDVRRLVVMCAQNNTPEHPEFWQALKVYSAERNAPLVVFPTHYKNISLYTANDDYKKEWSETVAPFIIDKPLDIGGGIVLRPDVKIAATASQPLSGLEPIGGAKWTVFGHPQVAMRPVASPAGVLPKRMYTTGSVTVKNYSHTKLGAKGEFHHTIGALVIEILDNDRAHIRNISTKTGPFYDLDRLYTPEGSKPAGRILALTPGDEHVKFNLPEVRQATYDALDSITNELRPEYIFRNDVLDGYAGSHHHLLDDLVLFKKHHSLDCDYRAELDQVVAFINDTTPADSITCIVPSNHHDHLYKWLSRVDPKKDPQNALLIHELKHKQYTNALAGETTDPFEIYVAPRLTCKFKFLDRNQPFTLENVDHGQHGDIGPNGSRGSARALAKTTYKMVIGHSHSACIDQGIFQTGTSTGRLEYERGLGTHTNTHVLQYPDGRLTHVDIIYGDWRGRF